MENVGLTNINFFLKKYFEISIIVEIKDINNDIIVVENAGNMLNVRMLYAYELNKLQVGDSIELYIMLKDNSLVERDDGIEVNLVGYISKDIRCFCELLECSGVGISGSARVFEYIRTTGMDINFICNEIESGNVRFFTQFPGFGEKGSERLCRYLNLNEFRRLGNFIFINLDKTGDVQHDNKSKAIEQAGKNEALNREIGLKGESDMYCYKCGNKMIDGANFCSQCGTKIINGESKVRHSDSNEIKKTSDNNEQENSNKDVRNINEKELEEYITNKFSSQEKGEAIKYIKKQTGWSLGQCKSFVDKVQYNKKQERQRKNHMEVYCYEEDNSYELDQEHSNRGGFLSSLIRESTENSSKRNTSKKTKPDLIGSYGCIKGKKVGNFTQSCNFSCPLWHECSRGSSY